MNKAKHSQVEGVKKFQVQDIDAQGRHTEEKSGQTSAKKGRNVV